MLLLCSLGLASSLFLISILCQVIDLGFGVCPFVACCFPLWSGKYCPFFCLGVLEALISTVVFFLCVLFLSGSGFASD